MRSFVGRPSTISASFLPLYYCCCPFSWDLSAIGICIHWTWRYHSILWAWERLRRTPPALHSALPPPCISPKAFLHFRQVPFIEQAFLSFASVSITCAVNILLGRTPASPYSIGVPLGPLPLQKFGDTVGISHLHFHFASYPQIRQRPFSLRYDQMHSRRTVSALSI